MRIGYQEFLTKWSDFWELISATLGANEHKKYG